MSVPISTTELVDDNQIQQALIGKLNRITVGGRHPTEPIAAQKAEANSRQLASKSDRSGRSGKEADSQGEEKEGDELDEDILSHQSTIFWENDIGTVVSNIGTIVTNTSSSEVATIGDGLQDDKDALLSDIAKTDSCYGVPKTLSKASERMRNDKDVVLAAVKNSGNAIQYASKRLQDDKDVVLAAITKNAKKAIQCASERLKSDNQVALEAIKQDGECLKFLHPTMRSDKRFVITAAKSKPESIKYAMGGLNQDRDCLIAAGIWDNHYDDIKMRPGGENTRLEEEKLENKTTRRIVLSTRFSLNEESSKTATQFTLCLKANKLIKEGNFVVYSPNAFSKGSCDPEWTRFDWPCRGTFATCRMLEASLKMGPPTNACCWRYSFRYQLNQANRQENGGCMVQVIELRRTSVAGKSGWLHVPGPGQIIEREMAQQVGIKVFQIYQPGVYSPNLSMYVKKKAFGPKEIDSLVNQIIELQEGQSTKVRGETLLTFRGQGVLPRCADAEAQPAINNTPQTSACQEVGASKDVLGDSDHGSDRNSLASDDDFANFDDFSLGTVDDLDTSGEIFKIENVDKVIQEGQKGSDIKEGLSRVPDSPQIQSMDFAYPGFSLRSPMDLQRLKDKWQEQISKPSRTKEETDVSQWIHDDDDDEGSWLEASFSSLSWSLG